MSRYYTAPDGTKTVLREARYTMSAKAYKSDCRKAVPGDPERCLLALGVLRNPRVLHAWIGSGLDAYVTFKGQDGEEPHTEHFTIPVPMRRIVDKLDTHGRRKIEKNMKSAPFELRAPTPKRTLEARSHMNADRYQRIKIGAHEVKSRGPNKRRSSKLRPRAGVSRHGNVGIRNLEFTTP
jgi:hypothetical protein